MSCQHEDRNVGYLSDTVLLARFPLVPGFTVGLVGS